MAVKAIMVDVDGVLVDGRPEDGLHWQTSMQERFGFSPEAFHERFFAPHWEDIVNGRAGLMEHLTATLQELAPDVSPETFASYWFESDSRIAVELLQELATVRSAGIRVFLATNQEHLRAAYLMEDLRLAEHVDGIFYSAQLGVRKPDAVFFSKIEAALGLRGEEILLIDDSRGNIQAAHRAGWQTLHWTANSAVDTLRNFYA